MVAAFEWYQARQSGLGDEFLRSVAAVEEALGRNPERYALVHAPYRSVKLRKFPYGLHYRIVGNDGFNSCVPALPPEPGTLARSLTC